MTEPASGEAEIHQGGDDRTAMAEQAARERIAAASRRARWVLAFEATWPRIVPILCCVGLFLAVSWFGLWSQLTDLLRFGLLGLFGTVLLFLLVHLMRTPRPGAEAALARVTRESRTPHRPAAAFADALAQPTEDPLTLALWRAHRLRLLQSLDRLKAGWPAPNMNQRDPYALRFVVPLLLFVAFLVAGEDRRAWLADALRPTALVAEAAPRVDAWVTPPAYTGQPPIFLTGDGLRPTLPSNATIRVAEGSIVTVRMPEGADLAIVAATSSGSPIPFDVTVKPQPASAPGAGPAERRLKLGSDSTVAIDHGSRTLAKWSFAVVPDQPPKISPTRDPSATASGALSLGYAVSDDYGVVAAKAVITDGAPAAEGARPLIPPPEVPLNLPRLRMREGSGETIRDLSSHPWAGAKVKLVLVATDEIGQSGTSQPIEFVLPGRRFNNPLARAVVEQRRLLALDAGKADYVATALDALTLDPTKFDRDGVYLSLRSAYHRLTGARSDEDLVSVVDFLWEIALGIEDGNLSLAAQDLRAAQEALKNAIANNASDAELDKAMQNLREAMEKYLEAMARDAQQNPQAKNQPANPNARTMRPEDLAKMMDQIENLAKTGSKEAAQQMLSELQQMMENMEASRSQPGKPGEQGEANQALDKLGDMIRKQQQLMDQTFKLDPDTDGSGAEQPAMTEEERQKALDALRQGQQDLAKALEQLQKDMQGQGMQPDGKLGQAGRSMGQATEQLGQNQPGQAVGPQGQALQALRDGARNLADRMARQNGTGTRQDGNMPGQDPLGRQQPGRGTDLGSSVKVPDAIDTQRAREILDMIRKRLGEAARPLMERDYLERLLDRY